jgi:hypothetical protein
MPLGEPIVVNLEEELADRQRPIQRLVGMVLLLGLKDRATEVRFEHASGSAVLSYVVNGVRHELIPPPAPIAGAVVNRVRVMAELDFARREPSRHREINLQLGDMITRAVVRSESADNIERAIIELPELPTDWPVWAHAMLLRVLRPSIERAGGFERFLGATEHAND